MRKFQTSLLFFFWQEKVLIMTLWFFPTLLFFSAQRFSISCAGSSPGASQPADGASASPPSGHLLPPARTVKLLLHSHRTDGGVQPSAPARFQGRRLGPLRPSGPNISPRFIPLPRSFTFQFLHRRTFALKFITCSVFRSQKVMCHVGVF